MIVKQHVWWENCLFPNINLFFFAYICWWRLHWLIHYCLSCFRHWETLLDWFILCERNAITFKEVVVYADTNRPHNHGAAPWFSLDPAQQFHLFPPRPALTQLLPGLAGNGVLPNLVPPESSSVSSPFSDAKEKSLRLPRCICESLNELCEVLNAPF